MTFDFNTWLSSQDDSQEEAVQAGLNVKHLEDEAKKAREAFNERMGRTNRSSWKEQADGFQIQYASPTLSYSMPADALLSLKETKPELFSVVANSGVALSDEERAKLEKEKEVLDDREAQISALLESDRLSREPELKNDKTTAELLKAHGIDPEVKVVRKGSWKVVKYRAPKKQTK